MNRHELVAAFEQFRRESIWLRRCYNTHCTLYADREETNQLLWDVAANFFWDISRVFQEYCIQRICSLTDPAGSGSSRNLCVESINNGLREYGLLEENISALSERLHAYRKLVIHGRNKALSHFDLGTALKQATLGAHAPEDVEQFFEDLQGYCDEVGVVLEVGPLDFRATPAEGDATDLLHHLRTCAKSS